MSCLLCQDGDKPTIVDQNRPGLTRCIECGRDVTLAVARIRGEEECANSALQLSWRRQKHTKRACA